MGTIVQLIVAGVMSAGTKIMGAVFGEKVIIRVFVVLGDKLLGSSKNDLVKEIWFPVKDALEKVE